MINRRRAKRIMELRDWFLTNPKFTSPAFIVHRAIDVYRVSEATARSYAREILEQLCPVVTRRMKNRTRVRKIRHELLTTPFFTSEDFKPKFRKASEIKTTE